MAGSTGPQPLIYQLQFRDTSAHGRLFRQEMKRINAEGNRHISIFWPEARNKARQTVLPTTAPTALPLRTSTFRFFLFAVY